MKTIVIALCASMGMGSALAADVTASSCHKPIVPNRLAAPLAVERFNKKESLYEQCISQFVTDQRAIAAANGDPAAAKLAADSADAALAEFNAFLKDVVAQKGDDEPDPVRGLVAKPISSIPPEPAGAPRR